jgi:hypothetical protein
LELAAVVAAHHNLAAAQPQAPEAQEAMDRHLQFQARL